MCLGNLLYIYKFYEEYMSYSPPFLYVGESW